MIGKMRDRVDIINKADAFGDIGQTTPTWSVTETVWAWVKQIKPSFTLDAENKKNEKHYEIVIRDNTNLDISSKIRYNSQYMRVDGFSEVTNKDEFLKIKCVQSLNEVVTI